MRSNRAARTGLAAALVLTALGGCATKDPLDWAARLEPGWHELYGSGPPWRATFVRPNFEEAGDGHRMGWVQSEYKEGHSGRALSGAGLFEVDCENDRSRELEWVTYSQHDLRGVEVESGLEPGEWYRAPSDLDLFVPYACADGVEARKAAEAGGFIIPSRRHRKPQSRTNLEPEP